MELNPAVEGMQPFHKVSIPFTAGLSSRVLVPSVEGMSAEIPFLKVQIPSNFIQCKCRENSLLKVRIPLNSLQCLSQNPFERKDKGGGQNEFRPCQGF